MRLKMRLEMDPKRRCKAQSFRFLFETALDSRNLDGGLVVCARYYGTSQDRTQHPRAGSAAPEARREAGYMMRTFKQCSVATVWHSFAARKKAGSG
jgi:hypothetical protein